MDLFVIPTNKLQATIHLQGRVAALDELLNSLDESMLDGSGQVRSKIITMLDEIKEILD